MAIDAELRALVASIDTLRFRVDELFRQHHLVIALPQRDVHLDAAAPIEVRVLKEERD